MKYTDVIDVLKRRIREGDYLLHEIPGERRIAEETGVSYMTARKAVLELINEGVLSREPNGKLQIVPGYLENKRQLHAAFLFPAYPSSYLARCRLMASQAADQCGVALRHVQYVHWHDPVVRDTFLGAEGVVVIADTEPMPAQIVETIRTGRAVTIDCDLTAEGVPCVTLFPDAHILDLLEHLWSLGHRRIGCLNTQGPGPDVERRIHLWRTWLAQRGGEGTLWNDPVPAYHDPTPRAYRLINRLLGRGELGVTALVCTTQPAALGAMRACWENDIHVGDELAICTINNEPTGRYFCPSLTGLEMPDIVPILSRCFAWFGAESRDSLGSLMLQPEHATLLKGESTAPPQVRPLQAAGKSARGRALLPDAAR